MTVSPTTSPPGWGFPSRGRDRGRRRRGDRELFLSVANAQLEGRYFCIATFGFGEAIRLILNNGQLFGGFPMAGPGVPYKSTLPDIIIVDILAVIFLANLVRSRTAGT
jgi:ABC-type branched-subunit amino acid transport system permease subunit